MNTIKIVWYKDGLIHTEYIEYYGLVQAIDMIKVKYDYSILVLSASYLDIAKVISSL